MKIITVAVTLSILLVFSSMHVSDSALFYQILVTVKPEKTPIKENEFPVILGSVTDEASKPIANASVKLTFAKEVVTTTTDTSGNFRYQSVIPASAGDYMINAAVSKSGYITGYASSSYFVNPPPPATYSKTITGLTIVSGNYTVYLGKVTEWNLETTCFVDFGNQYKRFLKTCDLYNLAPDDFKTDTKIIPVISVIQHNTDFRLFSVGVYYNAFQLSNNTLSKFIISTWKNYTAPN